MLKEGQKAPAFTLESADGKKLSLSDFAGKNVVLYFYPRDNTPGCTREAEGFRDAAAALKKKNAVVLGVSLLVQLKTRHASGRWRADHGGPGWSSSRSPGATPHQEHEWCGKARRPPPPSGGRETARTGGALPPVAPAE